MKGTCFLLAELYCKSLWNVWVNKYMYSIHGSWPPLCLDIGTALFTNPDWTFSICSGHQNWLNLDKRVLEHDFARRAGTLILIFAVRWERVLIIYLNINSYYELANNDVIMFDFCKEWLEFSQYCCVSVQLYVSLLL